MNTEILEILEAFDVFEEDEVLTESYADNLIKADCIVFKKDIKALGKQYKKDLKAKDFNAARKDVKEMRKAVDKFNKAFRNIPEPSFTEAIVTTAFTTLARACVMAGTYAMIDLALSAVFGMDPSSVKSDFAFGSVASVVSSAIGIYKSDSTGTNKYNDLYNMWVEYIDVINKNIDKCEDNINKVEAKYKEEQKAEKETTESVAYENARLAIYEACANNEITLDEREDLLADLYDTFILNESASDTEDLTVKETFDEVKTRLYKECAEGKIDIDERERLLSLARNTYK